MSAPDAGLLESDPDLAARQWLATFSSALTGAAPASVAGLFAADGWWRDLLAFTWDLRSARGHEEIAGQAQEAGAAGFSAEVGPTTLVEAGSRRWHQAIVTFRTDTFSGRGVLRLVSEDGAAKAWILFTQAEELRGHPEAIGAHRPHGGAQGADRISRNWREARARQQEFLDGDPAVLVVGAGHNGLSLAARLGRHEVPTLLIDTNDRVGDSWRKRYDSLVLHDPVWYDHLPYLPFPANWPIYTPKDKLADWLESYAAAMELNVWTGTQLLDTAWDAEERVWTVQVRRPDGSTRTLHPRHLVLATGISGTEANVPTFAGSDEFAGTLVHAQSFPHGADFTGKRAVVVGSCNSGHDIAQELHELGAEVTMLQRSPTFVVSIEASKRAMAGTYDETGPATDIADLYSASLPYRATPDLSRGRVRAMALEDQAMLDGLHAAGFRTTLGPDDTGSMLMFLERGGGYYINVGCSELIIDGTIGVRSGVEIERFSPEGVHLDSGEHLPADVVVLATGYRGIVETARRLLGEEVAEACGPVWGLDAQGELQGVWRRSGHEGLWFMGGNLAMARIYGAHLALQIKAAEVGLLPALPTPVA